LLGCAIPEVEKLPTGLLSMRWSDLDRWSYTYTQATRSGLVGFTKAHYPIETLGTHLVDTMNGFCIKPVSVKTPHRMLKLNSLSPEGLDLEATKFIKITDKTATHFSLRAGDLLICRSVGSKEMIAKSALVTEDHPDILFPDIIIRARCKDTLDPAYVRELMQTPLGRAHFQANARTAVGMWKIGADDIHSFPLPIPPLHHQQELVAQVNAARKEIARERAAADALAARAAAEVEAMILGARQPA
jgi:restriction endonuclease S subunit